MNPFDVSLLGALAAGALSFLSPCVLPLIPAYLVFLGGEVTDARRVMPSALAFVLGFSTVFMVMGATATALSHLVADHRGGLSVLAGLVVMGFGLHVMGLTPIRWLYAEKRLHPQQRPAGPVGAYVLGLAFAFGWTPCIGPILAAILALAATQQNVAQGVGLLFVYSLGLGLPFILTGLALNAFLRFFARYKRFIRWGEAASGILLIAIGLLMLLGNLTWFMRLLPSSFYKF